MTGKSTEGGETAIYYQGDRPRVIVVSYYGETGRTAVRYYKPAAELIAGFAIRTAVPA